MRKLLYLSLAVLLTAGCVKETFITTPCHIDCKTEWIKGSKILFTVTPDNKDACYTYGLLSADQEEAQWSDEKITEWQMGWMKEIYEAMKDYEKTVDTFIDRFCFKGTRSFKIDRLSSDTDFVILVFQVNPLTLEAIGPLTRIPFKTASVPHYDTTFCIRLNGKDSFTLIPSDTERTWGWEYEADFRIDFAYGTPYSFFYEILGMYEEYDFLDDQLCKGPCDWTFSKDDPSIKEGISYTLMAAGCENGEITSDIHFAHFSIENGVLTFHEAEDSDIPVIKQ